MRVAVVGGTGSFGAALARRLVSAGYTVVIGSRDAERARLARSFDVELMTHPSNPVEYEYLMSDRHEDALSQLPTGSYWTMKDRCRTSASVSAPGTGRGS